jgi:hypothetical protein
MLLVGNDSLKLQNRSYNLEKLLNVDYIIPDIFKAYTFSISRRQYLLLLVLDKQCNGNNCVWAYNILFNISDKANIRAMPLLKKDGDPLEFLCTYPDYIGDFNKDDNPDFIYHNKDLNYDRLSMLSIMHDKIVFMKNNYLKIDSHYGSYPVNTCTAIIRDSSTWFYPLPETHASNLKDTCEMDYMLPDDSYGVYVIK